MLRFGRRMAGLMAAGAVLVVGNSALANSFPEAVAMPDGARVETAPSQASAAQPFTISQAAMGLMRVGRAADALALLEPAATRLGAYKGARATCAHDGRVARGAVLDEGLCDALFLRAFALTELGRRADAVDALLELTKLSPDYPRYFVELAYAYRMSGDKAAALATYGKAAAIAAQPAGREMYKRYHAAALRGIGALLVEKGDLVGGEKAYRASLLDDPESKVAANELKFIARERDAEMKGG